MILCLDVGNSHIYGGVFHKEKLVLRFRKISNTGTTSDELGLFLRSVLHENAIQPEAVKTIGVCSVVPDMNYSLNNACLKYFQKEPFFLKAGVKTSLKIRYNSPSDVGADRIANAIGAVQLFPNKNLIIVDFGTAITFCAVSQNREYLGGSIMPGHKISMQSLESRTARLPKVEIVPPRQVLGKSTVESIQSGLFYGKLGAVHYIIQQLSRECFAQEPPLVIGTGGFSSLYSDQDFFDHLEPDLVFKGLYQALQLNHLLPQEYQSC